MHLYFLQAPIERHLGHRIVNRKGNDAVKTKLVSDVFYEVPLELSLQQLLSNEFVFEEV